MVWWNMRTPRSKRPANRWSLAPELSALQSLFEAGRRGEQRRMRIVGEAGVGKSRLLLEAKALLGEQPHAWIECQASQLTSDSPFRPVAAHLRHAWEIDSAPSNEAALAKVDAALTALGLRRGELRALFAEDIEATSRLLNRTLPW